MKVENIYSKGEISLLNLVSDYVTEEECSISNLYQAYCKNELTLIVRKIKVENKQIPVILLTNVKGESKDYYIEESLTKLNQKIEWKKKSFNKLTKDIDSLKEMSFSESNSFDGELSTENLSNEYHREDKVLLNNELFTTVFVGGCEQHCIAFCPNWFNTYATKKELKESRRNLTFKQNTKLFKSEEIISEVFIRRVKLYNQLENIIESILKAYEEGLLCVMGGRKTLPSGLNLITINSSKNKELMKKHKTLVVFDVTQDTITLKSDEVIKEEVKHIKIYEKEEKAFIKKLDKVKTKLKKNDRKWFALNTVQKYNGVWNVWLNPYEQSLYNCGWYTLEELILWITNEGPICKHSK